MTDNAADARSRGRARRPVIGVLGSGDESFAAHRPAAAALGGWIAREGWHLLTGGGGGMMAAVSQGFGETPGRPGLVIGIIPGTVPELPRLQARAPDLETPVAYDVAPAYPNPWVEVPIFTHLPLSGPEGTHAMSRNHINVLSADVLVGLPGGAGTQAELWLACQYGVPAIAFHPADLELPIPEGVPRARTLEEVVSFVRARLQHRSA